MKIDGKLLIELRSDNLKNEVTFDQLRNLYPDFKFHSGGDFHKDLRRDKIFSHQKSFHTNGTYDFIVVSYHKVEFQNKTMIDIVCTGTVFHNDVRRLDWFPLLNGGDSCPDYLNMTTILDRIFDEASSQEHMLLKRRTM